jgi:glycosyltransferase involved in cell wall biosynthesis
MDTKSEVLSNSCDDAIKNSELLRPLWMPETASMFWRAVRLGVGSSWYGHIPFAHWVVQAVRPRSLVELGTHNGVSYSAFCEAVAREGLDTRCYAIDTWKGDEHAAHYDDTVYWDLRSFHDSRYGSFSELLRCTFDEALPHFPDGSVDLLHIDGFHTYEAVSHDFEAWSPKLSDRAVVLLHDTNVFMGNFGVWRLWDELKKRFATFEFLHAYGLGVLGFGRMIESQAAALFELSDRKAVAAIRERFALLGERWVFEDQTRHLLRERETYKTRVAGLDAQLAQRGSAEAEMVARAERAEAAAALARTELAKFNEENWRLRQTCENLQRSKDQVEARAEIAETAATRARSEAARRAAEIGRARAEIASLAIRVSDHERIKADLPRAAIENAQSEQDRLKADLHRVTRESEFAQEEIARVQALYDELTTSSVWRATRPIRAIGDRLPQPFRKMAQLAWWTATLRLPQQLPAGKTGALPAPALLSRPPEPPAATDEGPGAAGSKIDPGGAGHVAEPDSWEPDGLALSAPIAAESGDLFYATRMNEGRKLLRIVYVSGQPETPGNRYRVLRHTEAAATLGAEVSWIRHAELPAQLREIAGATVLVIWRATWDTHLSTAVEAARRAGAKIMFDIDDLIVDPNFARVEVNDYIRSTGQREEHVRAFYERMRMTMMSADFCCATTPELASHMRRFQKPTFVLPNGFDSDTLSRSRFAVRQRRAVGSDGLVRIGYAAGTRTHQRDFALAAEAVGRVLRERPQTRLVLFRVPNPDTPILDLEEFPALVGLEEQIEWRNLVPLDHLPEELARFDVNIAPLELGNPFCEAKSELKFVEAALVSVCTVASPTGPYRRAVRDGVTGFLATDPADWQKTLLRLVDEPELRRRVAQAAFHDVLWEFGPERRVEAMASILEQLQGGRAASRAFELEFHRSATRHRSAPTIPESEIVFARDRLGQAEVTIVVPLHNYGHAVVETLESVRAQTVDNLDLVMVDDCSTDDSLAVALEWVRRNDHRFNRTMVLRNRRNSGRGPTRNTGFDAAETPFVFPLDAGNLLRPECCIESLAAVRLTGAVFAYPVVQRCGTDTEMMGRDGYVPIRLAGGNYIDAMALVSKAAWAAVGGYEYMQPDEYEDYDFWCRCVERGMLGHAIGGRPLADYRVQPRSMDRTAIASRDKQRHPLADIKRHHPWISDVLGEPEEEPVVAPGLDRDPP